MSNQKLGIKTKLFLGYFILVILAGFTGWLVYTEFARTNNKSLELSPVNEKVIFINDILTNLYNAEGLERNLVYTGEVIYYAQYQHLLDTIRLQIDSLNNLIKNPFQKKHADSVKILLDKKQKNLEELMFLKNNYSLNALYKKTLKNLEEERDSTVEYYEINQRQTKTYDTVYIKQEKKPFIRRLFKAFGDQQATDSAMQVKISEYVQTDSTKNNVNPADSISNLLTNIRHDLVQKSERAERQIRSKELTILNNDKTITLQLKKILTIIENQELLNSLKEVRKQQQHNAKITWIILVLGVISLFTIVFFGANILSDISKSQHYRISLEAAKTETEKVLKSKEQFMLSLTHDLKSPLNAIIGFTRLIENERLNLTISRYLKNIDRSSRHILELVNQLLDLAKLQQGKLRIIDVPFNLSLLVEQLAENYKVGAIQKNVRFNLENQLDADRNYKGDPVRITQILVNLLSNAIKFTKQGAVDFKLSIKSHDKKRDIVKLEVIDTGIGIDLEDLPHIFEEFTRGKADTQKFEGTGLGLAITYKLVQLLNGEIKINSEVGKGSHFKVYLPLELTDDIPETNVLEDLPGSEKRAYRHLEGLTVWLVDDDIQMLEMVEAVLLAENIKVRAFNKPQRALQEFKAGCANLLITDMQMPGMEGIDLLGKIENKIGEAMPAIAMSGRDDHPGFDMESHFLAFIQKPFEPDKLLNIIYQNLDRIKKDVIETVNNESIIHYDLSNIKQFLGEDSENLNRFLVSYTSTSIEHLNLLEDYSDKKDFKGISELAHKMLNILHQLKADDLIAIFKELETFKPTLEAEGEFLALTEKGIVQMRQLVEAICANEGVELA